MGLLRTAARTAVIAGTATRVHGAVSARQHDQWARQTVAPAPAPPPAPPRRDTADVIAQLKDLGELRAAGVLTTSEFQAQKDRILYG
jgi:hypothetical protein